MRAGHDRVDVPRLAPEGGSAEGPRGRGLRRRVPPRRGERPARSARGASSTTPRASRSSAGSSASRSPAAASTPRPRRSRRFWAASASRSSRRPRGSAPAARRARSGWAARSSATSGKENDVSRIGRMPIAIPKGVEVKARREARAGQGPQRGADQPDPAGTRRSTVENGRGPDRARRRRAAAARLHGLLRSLVANASTGVTKGFSQGPRDRRASATRPRSREGGRLLARLLPPDRVPDPRRHRDRARREGGQAHGLGRGPAEGRPDGRRDPQAPRARPLQGQGHQVRATK